jgi:hypothetical protein
MTEKVDGQNSVHLWPVYSLYELHNKDRFPDDGGGLSSLITQYPLTSV